MPKRTKREKMLAEKRRHDLSTPRPMVSSVSQVRPPETHTFSYTLSHVSANKPMPETDTEELTVIRHDVVKTVILAVCAIAVELTIYAVLRGK